MSNEATIETLTQIIRKSAKYRHMSDALVRQIVARELEAGRPSKAVVKGVKNKLHQIGGAFFTGKARYDAWLSTLAEASASGDPLTLQNACKSIMVHHASTRERISILNEFYPTILADMKPIQSILDLACGLNPLSIPWLPLSGHIDYYACDIYGDLIAFLAEALPLLGVDGRAFICDLSIETPAAVVDLALVMKSLPTLMQIDKEADVRLLTSLQARHILVSYPARSLGGRNKQMVANYERDFYTLAEDQPWSIKCFEFSSELAFLVTKTAG